MNIRMPSFVFANEPYKVEYGDGCPPYAVTRITQSGERKQVYAGNNGTYIESRPDLAWTTVRYEVVDASGETAQSRETKIRNAGGLAGLTHVAEVPRFIRADADGYAITQATEVALAWLRAEILSMLEQYFVAENATEATLAAKAWELDLDWYIPDADRATKREIILGARDIYRTLGTKYAVRRVAAEYFGDAVVEESWQYSGAPFHFRVRTANIVDGTRAAQQFLYVVDKVKNARSVMDGIVIESSIPRTQVFAATRMQTYKRVTLTMKER